MPSKTNKPQGGKASVDEAGSLHLQEREVWVVHLTTPGAEDTEK